jgi:hypothetical protein
MLHRTLAILLILAPAALADAPLAPAKHLFERFQAALRAGDESARELFADDWKRSIAWIDPAGKRHTVENVGMDYPEQEMHRRETMNAIATGGTGLILSDVKYDPEGDGVRINFAGSEGDVQSAGMSLLVRPTASRKWLIFEVANEMGSIEGEELARMNEVLEAYRTRSANGDPVATPTATPSARERP